MSQLKKFQHETARPLPIIILADTSGSMSVDGKIEALNLSLQEMIKSFATESRVRAELQVSVITFGGLQAEEVLPLTPAHAIEAMSSFDAAGPTPMGGAFQLANALIEDSERIPYPRAYKPVVVLVSDGYPTDDWQSAFEQFNQGKYSAKATRFAMAIGNDADETMLSEFANDPEAPLFRGQNARDIHRFFRAVTMSVTTRSRSATPNQSVELVVDEADDVEWEF
ncbi:vWA domain-containing protein [Salinibius halmophilus]|uniref:vWA domain-containing protein n=1 Tax=Salinibius halmophilus TaxID=1853216 RepID=UPI000E66D356|nr:VWA domain-containing protein [Salinibius halmophilus]